MTRIWIIGHRHTEEPYWDNELYSPLQVGFSKNILPNRDNKGVNIAAWNRLYAEMTGWFWVYKNADLTDYVGMCQYRRRLRFKDADEVENIFKSSDAIAAEPLKMGMSPRHQYESVHNPADMELAERIVKEKYPELKWDRVMERGRTLFYSNGVVLKRQDFLDYCDFYFGFAEEFLKRKGWDSVEKAKADIEEEMIRGERRKSRGVDYQCEVLGFLSERMLTLWLLSKYPLKRIKTVKYVKYEGV